MGKAKPVSKPMVYMAGSMRNSDDWRKLGITDRDRGAGAQLEATIKTWRESQHDFVDFIYTGPFATSCDHGCAHRSSHMAFSCSQSSGQRFELVKACTDAISRCDIFGAYINRTDLFGTFVEIGIARSMGKIIWIGFDPYILDFKDVDGGQESIKMQNHDHELWFVARMADSCWYGDGYRAHVVFRNFVKSFSPNSQPF